MRGASPQPRFVDRNFAVFSRNDYCANAKTAFSKIEFKNNNQNLDSIVLKKSQMASLFSGPLLEHRKTD